MAVFENLLVIGTGLIGSSLARAAKKHSAAHNIWVADKSEVVVERVKALGFADKVSTDLTALAAEADLVILATPPGVMAKVAGQILPVMKTGAILSDVGSIKNDIATSILPLVPEGIGFVPGHPIAGTEKSGPDAGFAELFEERWCVLTPQSPTDFGVEKVKAFWEALGSQVAIMEPERHDLVLATTSHVPHLIAYTLVGTAIDMETVTNNEVVKYSAGGFRDFTRIAASDPAMWRDVCLQNREGVLEVVDRFIEDLTALKRAIRWGQGDVLYEQFTRTRDIRRRIIDAGQDTSEADFGRREADED